MHLIALSVLFIGFCAEGADYLIWHPKARTFDFRIRDLPLEKFLGIVLPATRVFQAERDSAGNLFAAGPLYTWQVLEAQSKKKHYL